MNIYMYNIYIHTYIVYFHARAARDILNFQTVSKCNYVPRMVISYSRWRECAIYFARDIPASSCTQMH